MHASDGRAVALRERLMQLSPLSPQTWAALLEASAELSLAKGEYFSQPGWPATRIGVVLSGLVRHFYVDAKGRESVKAFRGPLEFTAPYAELILGRPSRTFIQALAPTALLCFDMARVDALAEGSVELQRLARRFGELHFVQKEQREYEFLQLSAGERYERFCAERPGHLADIPQHQVASYIGITPVALSRIRARRARRR